MAKKSTLRRGPAQSCAARWIRRTRSDMEEHPRVIDADGHTLEPPDALSRFLDPKYRDRLEHGPEGLRGRRQVDGLDVMEHPPGTLEALRFTPERVSERFGDIAADGFDAHAVVRALDV